ncbi:MAG: M48 family metalloprotease [Acaryochloridaceae cyanobacterium RL_2_7]|nr:M48 family metalloprotease [Acaryochloridaceae cyanobacterium RL_2_7]
MNNIVSKQLLTRLCLGLSLWIGGASLAPSVQASEFAACKTQVPKSYSGNRDEVLRQGDRCHQEGQLEIAQKWYRLGKKSFTAQGNDALISDPIYEPEELSNKGKVFWKNYEQYKDQTLVSSGAFIPLYLLIKSDPGFVPGYLALAQLYEMAPDWCTQKAYAPICKGNPRTKGEVLELATAQFPDDPELTQAMIDAYVEERKYLDASIAARQFSLFFPDYPGSEQFSGLSDKYMKRYRRGLKTNSIASSVVGCSLSLLVDGQLSGCGIALMLAKGESSFGSQLASDRRKKGDELQDEVTLRYIKDISDKLTPLMGREDFEYEYHVVKDDSMNAFVYPGGKIFVTTGLILKTKSEAELAGVLAHEISHAVFSHGYQRMAEFSLSAGINTVLPVGGLLEIANLSHSRSREKQADILGTRVLASAGYAADGLRNFMQTLNEAEGKSNSPGWLKTHPDSERRVRYLEELILRSGYNQFG